MEWMDRSGIKEEYVGQISNHDDQQYQLLLNGPSHWKN